MRPDPNRVRVAGPLAKHAAGFCDELARSGYPPERAARHMQLLAQLSRWMESQGLGECDLSEAGVAAFLDARRAMGYSEQPSLSFVTKLLGRVPGLEMAPAEPAPLGPVESAISDYGRYLDKERALAAGTIRGYLHVARLFLTHQASGASLDFPDVTAEAVITFVVEEARRRSVGGSQVVVTAMRSLLRFLFLDGRIAQPLGQAVPAVSAPKGFLPRGLSDEVVAALLKSCDTATVVGKRDLAILVLLSRLGLRAGEVARLSLDDLDWHRGELVVRGKGSRRDRLPLPVDVGEVLATYVSGDRPRVECRAMFLRVHAPITAMTVSNVSEIVRRACRRAGVPEARAHRLRHSAATAMLRSGASLAEIGQILRQSHDVTTSIYAKVDRFALRTLARPWPGALS